MGLLAGSAEDFKAAMEQRIEGGWENVDVEFKVADVGHFGTGVVANVRGPKGVDLKDVQDWLRESANKYLDGRGHDLRAFDVKLNPPKVRLRGEGVAGELAR